MSSTNDRERRGSPVTTPVPPPPPTGGTSEPKPPSRDGKYATYYPLLGGRLPIIFKEDVDPSMYLATLNRITAALDIIDGAASQFTTEETRVVRLLKSIVVAAWAPSSSMNEQAAEFTLRMDYIYESSPVWLASAICHDSFHIHQFQRSGGTATVWGVEIEREAMDFQMVVGKKLGLSQYEIDYLGRVFHTGNY